MSDGPDPRARGAAHVEAEVRARIAPDPATQERVRSTARRLVEHAERAAAKRPVAPAKIVVAGSAARGTYLKDRLDIDLFFLYPPTLPRAELEREGLALAGAVLERTETRYAEHPYLRGWFEGFAVDAVPGFAVEDPAKPLSAVDRTPFHQAFLAARQTPEMVDDVRLLKQFLRAHRLYGSEARTGGFSGYVVELLVLKFGTFHKVLEEGSRWRLPVRVVWTPGDPPRVPDDVALVMDDPVDPNRNVATALSRRNLALFVLSARAFLKDPHAGAFELPPPVVLSLPEAMVRIRTRGTHVASLRLPRPDAVDDVLYPQVRKAERAVGDEARRLGFEVIGTASAAGSKSVLVLIEVGAQHRPTVRVRPGPPAGIDRVGSFLDKWATPEGRVVQGPYVDEAGQLAVETLREERSIEGLLREAVPRLPLGRDLRGGAPASAKVAELSELEPAPELEAALAELLDKRLPYATSRSTPEGR